MLLKDYIQQIFCIYNNKLPITFILLKFIPFISQNFSKKYSLRYSVSYSEVERVVGYDTPMFPIPYKRYKIEYNDGSEKTIGYKVLGLIFITDEI